MPSPSTPKLFGTVYLIHLHQKMAHSQHYIGFAYNVHGRLFHHRNNRGSKFLRAANRQGIPYQIVREWVGDRNLERKLKNRKKARLLCPICNAKVDISHLYEGLHDR